MHIRTILRTVAFLALTAFGTTAMAQEVIRLRIASGHPPANTYVNLMQNFFVPEVTKRVAEKTKYKVEFVEGYGGAMVKVADTLEGVQAGIIDIGGYCFCFEPSNLPLHAFQVMLPFGTMDPTVSLKVARAVYDKVPYMSKVFEDKFKQKLIALIADNGYNLGTNFEWNSIADIKGQKIAGAGLNLKWLEFAGATPVQSSLPDAYTSMQTGVYNGWIMFPSGWVNFKLYEVGKFYTEIGFGAITWHGLTINSARWAKLPKEVQDVILEVAKEYEAKTGTVNKENYPKQLADLKGHGVNVRTLPDKVRQDWANSLAAWPAQKGKGDRRCRLCPGTQVLGDCAQGSGRQRPQVAGPLRHQVTLYKQAIIELIACFRSRRYAQSDCQNA
jgi:TRAP-type C4-dicarboxylate transport system substrate-binding protein